MARNSIENDAMLCKYLIAKQIKYVVKSNQNNFCIKLLWRWGKSKSCSFRTWAQSQELLDLGWPAKLGQPLFACLHTPKKKLEKEKEKKKKQASPDEIISPHNNKLRLNYSLYH